METEEQAFILEVEEAKSWFELSKLIATFGGFILLVYILITNLGMNIANIPVEVYLKSLDNPSLNTAEITTEIQKELGPTLDNIKQQRDLLFFIFWFLMLTSLFLWAIGKAEFNKIAIRRNLREARKMRINYKSFFILCIIMSFGVIIFGAVENDLVFSLLGIPFIVLSILFLRKLKAEKGKVLK